MGVNAQYGVSAPDHAWYRKSVALTASANATRQALHEVDLVSAAGNVVITLPTVAQMPYYIGAVNASALANGSKVVIIQTSAAVEVCRLSAAGESVWIGKSLSGAWEILARSNPSEYQWTWANATARMATLESVAQVGAIGYQTDMEMGFQLISAGPARWGQILNPAFSPLRGIYAINNTAVPSTVGIAIIAASGTNNVKNAGGATRSLQAVRTQYASAAPAGSVSVFRSFSPGPAGLGGIWHRFRFVIDAVSASERWAVGISGTLPGPGNNVDPNTFTDCLVVGRSGAGINDIQVYNNDAAGVATQATISGYPANTANYGYDFQVYSRTGSSYTYQLTKMDTLEAISATLNSNIPTPGTNSTPLFYCCNNVDASIVSLDMASYVFAPMTT